MRSILSIITFLYVSFAYGQEGQKTYDPWLTLSMVTMESEYDEMMGMEIQKATPSPIVKAMHGKEIEIRGFMIALDVRAEQSHFMFSRYPQNMCFFCGAAGPESAMQVFLANGDKEPHTTHKVRLKGTLNIQSGDPSGLIYTLTDATLLEIIK